MAGGRAEGMSMKMLKAVEKAAVARVERKARGLVLWELKTNQYFLVGSGAEKGERGFWSIAWLSMEERVLEVGMVALGHKQQLKTWTTAVSLLLLEAKLGKAKSRAFTGESC